MKFVPTHGYKKIDIYYYGATNIARAFIISLVLTVGGVCGVWADDVYMMGGGRFQTWDRALLGEALRGVEADARPGRCSVGLLALRGGLSYCFDGDKPSDEGVASVLETVRAGEPVGPGAERNPSDALRAVWHAHSSQQTARGLAGTTGDEFWKIGFGPAGKPSRALFGGDVPFLWGAG